MARPLPRRRPVTAAALLAIALGGGLSLGGCADISAGYPSLAPRPIEQLSLAEPTTPVAPPQVASPAALARYAPTIERARTADADFRRTLEQELPALARGRGAASGSDAWSAAQVSLSRIETAREPVAKALADLDAARNAEPTERDTGEALAAEQAFDEVQKIDTAETDAMSKAWPR